MGDVKVGDKIAGRAANLQFKTDGFIPVGKVFVFVQPKNFF